VSESLVYAWCQKHILRHARFGRLGKRGKIFIEDSDLDAFDATYTVEVVRSPVGYTPTGYVPKHFTLD
jgi:hypothetical protein